MHSTCVCVMFSLGLAVWTLAAHAQTPIDTKYSIHDRNRPSPAVVDPGTASSQQAPGRPPSDAVVLFDGKDLAEWRTREGGPAKWKVAEGYFEVVPGTGQIYTRR